MAAGMALLQTPQSTLDHERRADHRAASSEWDVQPAVLPCVNRNLKKKKMQRTYQVYFSLVQNNTHSKQEMMTTVPS